MKVIHILIAPPWEPTYFFKVQAQLSADEVYVFDDTTSKDLWTGIVKSHGIAVHYRALDPFLIRSASDTHRLSQFSKEIVELCTGKVQRNVLIYICMDSRMPIFLIDAWITVATELQAFHRDHDVRGSLNEPASLVFYTVNTEYHYLLLRPFYPFWDQRVLNLVHIFKEYKDADSELTTTTDVVDGHKLSVYALHQKYIESEFDSTPRSRTSTQRVFTKLKNWVQLYPGFEEQHSNTTPIESESAYKYIAFHGQRSVRSSKQAKRRQQPRFQKLYSFRDVLIIPIPVQLE